MESIACNNACSKRKHYTDEWEKLNVSVYRHLLSEHKGIMAAAIRSRQ